MAGVYAAVSSSDDELLAAASWVIAGFGSIITLIGVIGWGVLIGLRADRRETDRNA